MFWIIKTVILNRQSHAVEDNDRISKINSVFMKIRQSFIFIPNESPHK